MVAADIAGDRASVTIDAGSDDGIQVGNAVLTTGFGRPGRTGICGFGHGPAGDRPEQHGRHQSAAEQGDGVATGSGIGQDLEVAVLNPAAEIELADQVVSLGSPQRNGIPADLPVGVVQALTRARPPPGAMPGFVLLQE